MSKFTPSVLRDRRPEPTHDPFCPLKRAMAQREVAPYQAPQRINPNASQEIGKGDRIIAEAKKQMLNPFYVPEHVKVAESKVASSKASNSVFENAFASVRAGMAAAHQRATTAQPQQTRAPVGVTFQPTISKATREAYERAQRENAAFKQGEE